MTGVLDSAESRTGVWEVVVGRLGVAEPIGARKLLAQLRSGAPSSLDVNAPHLAPKPNLQMEHATLARPFLVVPRVGLNDGARSRSIRAQSSTRRRLDQLPSPFSLLWLKVCILFEKGLAAKTNDPTQCLRRRRPTQRACCLSARSDASHRLAAG